MVLVLIHSRVRYDAEFMKKDMTISFCYLEYKVRDLFERRAAIWRISLHTCK